MGISIGSGGIVSISSGVGRLLIFCTPTIDSAHKLPRDRVLGVLKAATTLFLCPFLNAAVFIKGLLSQQSFVCLPKNQMQACKRKAINCSTGTCNQ
jgi:hypothetical protein